MKYIKFNIDRSEKVTNKKSLFERILNFILPKTNPDYNDKIDLVVTWFLEFDDENSLPNREIGIIDELKKIKMPYKDNYGYWTDNNLKYEDFKKLFSPIEVTNKDFNYLWDSIN